MEQQFKILNIWLTISLVMFFGILIVVSYNLIPIPESFKNPLTLIAILFGFLFYGFLGMLASKKNRSVIKWVGLTIICLPPISLVVAYFLMLNAEPLPKPFKPL